MSKRERQMSVEIHRLFTKDMELPLDRPCDVIGIHDEICVAVLPANKPRRGTTLPLIESSSAAPFVLLHRRETKQCHFGSSILLEVPLWFKSPRVVTSSLFLSLSFGLRLVITRYLAGFSVVRRRSYTAKYYTGILLFLNLHFL